MAITLSRTDRLILANQFQILAALNQRDADHYRSLIEIAQRGFSERYSDLYSGVQAEELSPEECEYVGRVLEMFWNLQDSMDQLEEREGLKADDVIFPGFDGNNELEFIHYAKFLMGEDGFRTLRCVGNLTCHHATIDRYVGMLERYREVPLERRRALSAKEIRSILAI